MTDILSRLDDVMVTLLPYGKFFPVAPSSSRASWSNVRGETRQRVIEKAERLVGSEWPVLTASEGRAFLETGDRNVFEQKYFLRRNSLSTLALAECMDNGGRFIDEIVNLLWMICEETSWVLPAHLYEPGGQHQLLPDIDHPILDLFSTETGAILATVMYLLRDQIRAVSPRIGRRVERELQLRVIDPFINRDDFDFMGATGKPLNNWTPWCTCNCLTAVLFSEREENHRWWGVRKALTILDRYLKSLPEDGCCDEGVSYWQYGPAELMDALTLIYHATQRRVNMFDIPVLRALGDYAQYMHIDRQWYVNFADCPAKPNIEPDVLYRFGRMTDNDELARLGAYMLRVSNGEPPTANSREPALLRQCWAALDEPDILRFDARPPMNMQHYFPDTQVMTARSYPGASGGFFVACKGGHNAESHNHNDVGNCVIYFEGEPVLIDAGVETYSRATFSPKRYEIWTMQSSYHNLPEINGRQQQPGRVYAALDANCTLTNDQASFSLDISRAYPGDTGVSCWQRTVLLQRGEQPRVLIWELADFNRMTTSVKYNFLTYSRPQLRSSSAIIGRAALMWDSPLKATVTPLNITDASLASSWGTALYQLTLEQPNSSLRAKLTFTVLPRAELP